MRVSKLAQISAIVALLLAAAVMSAIAAHADDDRDTFSTNPDDTFYIDQDGPDQDKRYDTDDPKYDEMDDLDHDECCDEDSSQTLHLPLKQIETFWI